MLRRTPKGSPGGIWRKVPERLQQAAMKSLSVNPYALPNFIVGADAGHIRKANLPQPFKRSCYQIWCTVTGGT